MDFRRKTNSWNLNLVCTDPISLFLSSSYSFESEIFNENLFSFHVSQLPAIRRLMKQEKKNSNKALISIILTQKIFYSEYVISYSYYVNFFVLLNFFGAALKHNNIKHTERNINFIHTLFLYIITSIKSEKIFIEYYIKVKSILFAFFSILMIFGVFTFTPK